MLCSTVNVGGLELSGSVGRTVVLVAAVFLIKGVGGGGMAFRSMSASGSGRSKEWS
jgi:hypothetical protein